MAISSFSPTPLLNIEELANQQHRTFTCQFNECGTVHRVAKDVLLEHLESVHGYTYQRGLQALCLWAGCVCAGRAFRIGRCPDGPHVSHVEDLAEHVWDRHLQFRWVCPNCDGAEWSDRASLVRHMQRSCLGRNPVRCGRCFHEFASEHDLATHPCSAPA